MHRGTWWATRSPWGLLRVGHDCSDLAHTQPRKCNKTTKRRCYTRHAVLCSAVSHSLWPHGLEPATSPCPWDFPGKKTGVGSHRLHQGFLLITLMGLESDGTKCR